MKNYREIKEQELIQLINQDDREAFCELYVRYKDKLWSFCYKFLKSGEDTDDIIQDIFTYLWESRKFINPDLSFSSFLFTMTKNRILNHIRSIDITIQVQSYLAQQPVPDNSSMEELEFRDLQQVIVTAIEQLPPRRKEIFNLSRNENLPHKQIAEQLGISVYTVQEHISESLKFIRKYINRHAGTTISFLLFLNHLSS